MSSDKKIRSNRRNAKRSTGPKTATGKKRSSGNATKHGLHSKKKHLIKGEDPNEYEDLRDAVRHLWRPVGPIEARIADQILGYHWRLDRIDEMERTYLNDLLTFETGKRLSELDPAMSHGVGRNFQPFVEAEVNQMIRDAGQSAEPTSEDLENVLKCAASDTDLRNALSAFSRWRQANLRGKRRCEDELEALQERRRKNEERERMKREEEQKRKEEEEIRKEIEERADSPEPFPRGPRRYPTYIQSD